MLGSLRLALAVLVAMNHLWLPTASKMGAHAVLAFYVISGFLITKIRSEIYVGPSGMARYFANRFLRIFPAYWMIVILTVIGLVLFPTAFDRIHSAIRLPHSPYEWLQNIALFDFIYSPLRLVPPAWSLSVEIIFYFLIGIGISKSKGGSLIWWFLSLVYTVYLVFQGADFDQRYTPPLAASLFFATGAVGFHFLKDFKLPEGKLSWWILLLLFFSLWPLFIEFTGQNIHMLGFYGAYILFLPLFAWTVCSQPGSQSLLRLDRLLGDLAYPVFLSHFFAAGLTNLIFGTHLTPLGLPHFLISLALSIGLGLGMVRWLDSSVNQLRNRIRPTRTPTLPGI